MTALATWGSVGNVPGCVLSQLMVAGKGLALISVALRADTALGSSSGTAVQPKLGAVSTVPMSIGLMVLKLLRVPRVLAAGSVIKSPNNALTAPSPRP